MSVELITRVRVYSNGAVIIPKEVRARLDIKPGEEMLLVMNSDSIQLFPSGITAQVLMTVIDQLASTIIRGGVYG